ncbi:hypothetical protein H5T56_01140 [Candidatus Bipolaricaulota bacterium]|nr:hypothetical protein [Candidatus Bipolaricaulota bacterium]
MALGISLASLIFVPLSAYLLFRRTILDVTHLRANPWPLIWYFTLMLVLVPLVVVNALGIENVPGLYVAQPGTESIVTLLVVAVITEYILTLAFSLRLFGLNLRKDILNISLNEKRLYDAVCALSLLGLLCIVVFYFLGYKHAFLSALLENKRLLEVRLANKYTSHVPSQIASIMPLIGYFLAAVAGYIGRQNLVKSFWYLVLSVLFLSAPGDKAPPIWGIIIWVLAQGALLPKHVFSVRSIIGLGFVSILGLGAVYFVTSIQVPGMTREAFFKYLLVRLGVGQMAGVYETFGLVQTNSMPEGDFYLHMIPGAQFFVNYTDFQKVLMMVTEGYGYAEMGVKNTLFIAEAWAIGGLPLALLSPIIVGISTGIGLAILVPIVRQIVGKELAPFISLILYLKTHDITGGFSSFPLFKGLILVLGQIAIIFLLYYLVIAFKKMLKNVGPVIRKPIDNNGFKPRKVTG